MLKTAVKKKKINKVKNSKIRTWCIPGLGTGLSGKVKLRVPDREEDVYERVYLFQDALEVVHEEVNKSVDPTSYTTPH